MKNNVNFNATNKKLNIDESKKVFNEISKLKPNIKLTTDKIDELAKDIQNTETYKLAEKTVIEINSEILKLNNNIDTEYQNTQANIARTIQSVLENYNNTSNAEEEQIVLETQAEEIIIEEATPDQNKYKTYDLTQEEIDAIAYLCYKEQGTVKGAADEASLMANRYELYADKEKYPTLYDYIRNCKWWANSKSRMDNPGEVSPEIEAAVYDVLVEGNRTLPVYVDEHDYSGGKNSNGDIKRVTNNGVEINVKDRDSYISGVTKIENVYGATYTFYAFAGGTGDPMGYTNTAYRKAEQI